MVQMKKLPQTLKYLIWPGLMLVTAGIVVGLLNSWTVLAVAFLVIGLLLLTAGVAAGDYASGRFWGRRATQAGTNAVVSVLSVLMILALINFLGARYDSRIDLTEGQLLTLSPASQEVVENLAVPTEVLIFSPAPNPQDQQLLESYRRFNSDFTYRYVDPFADPQLSQQLGVQSVGEVFLRSGEGEEQRTSLVQQITPESPLTERQITNKLVQIGQENVATAYFLQGHGEYAIDGSQAGYFEARSELQAQNYTVAPVDLANTGTIPPDADVVIIAGPKTKLFDNEVIAIQEYLEGGGSLMVLVDPQIETGLEVLMSQWGVVPEDKLVIDTSGGGQIVGLGPATALVQDYGDHPITAAFGNDRSFFPAARPLQIREVPDVEATTLLFTNQNSHAQALADGEQEIDPNRPPEGPLAIGVALSQSVEAIEEKQANTQADAAESADQAAAEEEATAELPSVEEAIEDSLTEEELLGDAVGNTDESAKRP